MYLGGFWFARKSAELLVIPDRGRGGRVDAQSDIHPTNQATGASVELSEWLLAAEPEPLSVQLYVMGSGLAANAADAAQLRATSITGRLRSRDYRYCKPAAPEPVFGSAAGAALAEFAASLPPLDTAFSLPVLMVDFGAGRGRGTEVVGGLQTTVPAMR